MLRSVPKILFKVKHYTLPYIVIILTFTCVFLAILIEMGFNCYSSSTQSRQQHNVLVQSLKQKEHFSQCS